MFELAECGECHNMFRDAPDTAGVCPKCGNQNVWTDDDEYPIGSVTC